MSSVLQLSAHAGRPANKRSHVKRLDAFGSATGDAFGADSDVDVLVEFDREPGKLFDRYFEFKATVDWTRKNVYIA